VRCSKCGRKDVVVKGVSEEEQKKILCPEYGMNKKKL